MRLILALIIMIFSASPAFAQEWPKATPEGKKSLDELIRHCVVAGGLKETKGATDKAPSALSIADTDKLKAAIKAHRELLTPKTRDALIARWAMVDQSQQPALTSVLELISDISDDDTARAFAAFFMAFRLGSRQEFDKFVPLFERAALLFKKTADRPWEAASLNNIGFAYIAKGEHDKAIEYLEKALAIQRAVLGERHPNVATSLNNIGSAYNAKREHDKAIEYYEKALAIQRAVLGQRHPDVAISLNNIGSAYDDKGEHDKAIEYYEKALEIRRAVLGERHADVAQSLNNIGLAYDGKGEHDKAIEYYEKALAINRAVLGQRDPAVATSLNNIGSAYDYKGEHDKAIEYFEKALAINRALLGDRHPAVATSLGSIGSAYSHKGEHDKAIEYYEKALAIERAVLGERHPAVATWLNNIGYAYNGKGEHDKAIEYYEKALAIERAVLGERHPAVATCLNNIGLAYDHKSEHDKAIEYYEKALAIERAVLGERHPAVATCLNNIGGAYDHKGEHDKAIEYFEKALAINRAVLGERHPAIATRLNNIGLAYDAKGEHDKAVQYTRDGLKVLRILENVNPKNDEFRADELRLLPMTATLTSNLALFLEKGLNPIPDRDRLNECLSAFQLASDVLDRLREKNLQTQESKLLLGEEYSVLYPRWIGVAGRFAKVDGTSKGPIQTFNAAERGASRGFLEELGRRNAKQVGNVDTKRLQEESKIDSAIKNVDARIAVEEKKLLKDRDIKKLGDLFEARKKQEGEMQSLIARMEKEFPMYAALKYPKACTVEEARACLDENELALNFVVGSKKSYLVVLRPKGDDKTAGISVHELPGEKEINKQVAALTEEGTIKSNANARIQGRKAFASWLGPVAKEIEGKNLVIVPGGALAFVPFEMLVEADKDNQEEGRWLVENHRIRYAPSLTVLHVINLWDKTRQRPDRTLWALGDPIFDKNDERLKMDKGAIAKASQPSEARKEMEIKLAARERGNQGNGGPGKTFQRLQATRDEVKAIAKTLDAPENVIALDDKATESTLKQASDSGELKRFRFIHLATHGILGSADNIQASLVFGLEPSGNSSQDNDGFLQLDEVTRLNLNADLVALSACETGKGRLRRGEGVTSIARAFMLSGSRGVLCSLWSVNDEATAALMASVYSKIQNGSSTSDAVRDAKLEMIDNNIPPFYWAAFISAGR